MCTQISGVIIAIYAWFHIRPTYRGRRRCCIKFLSNKSHLIHWTLLPVHNNTAPSAMLRHKLRTHLVFPLSRHFKGEPGRVVWACSSSECLRLQTMLIITWFNTTEVAYRWQGPIQRRCVIIVSRIQMNLDLSKLLTRWIRACLKTFVSTITTFKWRQEKHTASLITTRRNVMERLRKGFRIDLQWFQMREHVSRNRVSERTDGLMNPGETFSESLHEMMR